MRKHTETFHVNKDHKLVIAANFAVFKLEICGIFFKFVVYSFYLHVNEALHTPTLYIKMNHFISVFHTK